MNLRPFIQLSLVLVAGSVWSVPAAHQPDAAGFERIAQPFFKEHCVRCHGPEKSKGKLRIDPMLPNAFLEASTRAKWAEVLNAVNSHEMPPDDEPQPDPAAAGRFADWVGAELGRAEIASRSTSVVLRRLNRTEYNNTVRDLFDGLDFRPADRFPEDPAAGGFDNIGRALSLSPLHLELYYQSARQILDRAFVDGSKPPEIRWRFDPEENTVGEDRLRVKRDGNNILLNRGKSRATNGFTVIHHNSWDKSVGFRDFRLKDEGEYIIRFRAAGKIPSRADVVAGAAIHLDKRRDEAKAKNPNNRGADQQFTNDLRHFETHRMYDYGPPRAKVTVSLGGQPRVVAEMDVDAPESSPKTYEVRTRFTRESAGVTLEYAYDVPSVLENFWMQSKDDFARPELLIDWVELEGPLNPAWPPRSQTSVLGSAPGASADELAEARGILERFMVRAYRRPVVAAEVETKLALFDKARKDKGTFNEAVKAPLAAVLTSPNVLFLVEPAAPDEGGRAVDAHELASRLSYFLWSTMPDDELFRLARSGELRKPAVLRAQVDRMLGDPRSARFVENFAGQWLGLRRVGSNPPAKNLYPEYDRHLEISIVRETEAFFDEILRHDLDVRNLVRSDFVTVNERLARFYGIPGVRGDAMRRVPAPADSHRGGVLTHASILSITSNGTRTSPVSRGVWVLRTLLGTDPGLPVANAGEIAPKVPGIDKATVRQRLEIHRSLPACARCHDKIDPLGLALENFNAAGEWREQEGHGYNGRIDKNDPKIDASAKMPDGTKFSGVAGLQDELLRREDLFMNALTERLFTYALGRELGFSDKPAVKAAVTSAKAADRSLRSLIQSIAASEAFRTK